MPKPSSIEYDDAKENFRLMVVKLSDLMISSAAQNPRLFINQNLIETLLQGLPTSLNRILNDREETEETLNILIELMRKIRKALGGIRPNFPNNKAYMKLEFDLNNILARIDPTHPAQQQRITKTALIIFSNAATGCLAESLTRRHQAQFSAPPHDKVALQGTRITLTLGAVFLGCAALSLLILMRGFFKQRSLRDNPDAAIQTCRDFNNFYAAFSKFHSDALEVRHPGKDLPKVLNSAQQATDTANVVVEDLENPQRAGFELRHRNIQKQ